MVGAFDSVGELEIRSSADEADREPGFLDLTGREIGRYRIQQRLGRSGVTTVYQAYDIVDDVPVALKVLLHGSDAKLYNRFRQEAQTAAKLHHPHIVRTLRVGVTPSSDTAYIAMELVEGEDLAALLSTRRRISAEESCLLLEPIARALAYAHSQGIVHRDVKPSNILLRTVSGEVTGSVILDVLDYSVVPLLGDFGIARALDLPELTTWGRTVGTPAFMAPEQARGARNVDHRADLYALGAVFYRCITGRQPFIGSTVQILHAHVYEPVTISEEIQRNLSPRHIQILQRTLAKEPKDRYQSALELAADFARGVNPRLDELTAAEREEGTTLTLELLSVSAAPPPSSQTMTVLIAGAENGQPRPTVANGSPSQNAAVAVPTESTISQQPIDPHFDPVLDQKLQKWSSIILSLLLTFATVAALFFLLRHPYRILREMVGTPTPAPLGTTIPATSLQSSFVEPPSAPALASGGESNQRVSVLTSGAPQVAITLPSTSTPVPLAVEAVLPSPTPTFVAYLPTDVARLSPGYLASPLMAMGTIRGVATLEATADADSSPASCQVEIAEQLQSYVARLAAPLRASFQCATEQPTSLQGEFLPYAHGSMLYLHAPAKMLVSYDALNNGVAASWEDFPVEWREGDLTGDVATEDASPPVAPEDLQFYPTRMFARIWQLGTVRERLGMATTPLPESVTVVMQRFNQGLLVLRLPEHAQGRAILYIYPLTTRIF